MVTQHLLLLNKSRIIKLYFKKVLLVEKKMEQYNRKEIFKENYNKMLINVMIKCINEKSHLNGVNYVRNYYW